MVSGQFVNKQQEKEFELSEWIIGGLNLIKMFVFVMDKKCLFCKVETQFFYVFRLISVFEVHSNLQSPLCRLSS